MSGIKKLLQNLSKASSLSTKMPTVAPPPSKQRTYKDVELDVPKPGEMIQESYPSLSATKLEDIGTDEEFVQLDDLTRECVLTLMMYHEYLSRFTSEYADNPEFMDRVYETLDIVAQDKPIKKHLIHEMCPELFPYEILNKESPIPLEEKYKNLGLKESEKAKVIEQETQNVITVHDFQGASPQARLSAPQTPLPSNPKQRIKNLLVWDPLDPKLHQVSREEYYSPMEINKRHLYTWEQVKRTYIKSAELIDKYAQKLGSVGAALNYIKLKVDNRTPEEQEVIEGIEYVKRLMKEHYEYVLSVYEFKFKNVVLPFPMPEWLKKDYMATMEDLLNNRYVSDTAGALGVPDKTEQYLKEKAIREQKARDALALDEKYQKEAMKLIADKGDELLVRRDLNSKDDQLIRKMNMLSEMIEVKRPAEPIADFNNKFDPAKLQQILKEQMTHTPLEGEFNFENLVKILYLNNGDPHTYNIDFWAERLNIQPQKLKNIFYSVSFPVIQGVEPVGKLEFVEVQKKKEMFDLFQEHIRKQTSSNNI